MAWDVISVANILFYTNLQLKEHKNSVVIRKRAALIEICILLSCFFLFPRHPELPGVEEVLADEVGAGGNGDEWG